MNRNNTLFSTFEIDYSRVENLLYEELNLFVAGYDIQPIPAVQEMRAFFIAWMAVFFSEVISENFVEILTKRITNYRSDPDFETRGWMRLLPLDVALYAITGNINWLRLCIANIDHHTYSLRGIVLESLSLVANKLSFYDTELQIRTENNIRNQHHLCDWGVILLLATNGSREEKIRLLKKWHKEFGEKSWAYHVIDNILNGKSVPNTYFSGLMQEIQLYITQRLICKPTNIRKGSQQLHIEYYDSVNSDESGENSDQDLNIQNEWALGTLEKVSERFKKNMLFRQEINLKEFLDN